MIYEELRGVFHKKMQSGQTPKQIADEHDLMELDVVQTLRNNTPKIRGANYTDLKIPVPLDEIIEAYHANELPTLAELYGVSVGTLRTRLPKELKTKKVGRRKKPEVIEPVDRDVIIRRYYRSGRKLNACGVSSLVAKAVLEEEEIPIKPHGLGVSPIEPKHQLAILDSLIEEASHQRIKPQELFKLHRLIYGLTSNDPQAWKGHLLEWLLNGLITQEQAEILNKAIIDVEQIKDYQSDEEK